MGVSVVVVGLRAFLLAGLLAGQAGRLAAEDSRDIPRNAWPSSWFDAPRTASQVGLAAFAQSPMLDGAVASGQLPPVEERLPDDPIVVEPAGDSGEYGGTARLFHAGEQLLNVPEGPLRPGPQMRLNLPNFAVGAEYSDSSRTLTVTLRRGHRSHHPAGGPRQDRVLGHQSRRIQQGSAGSHHAQTSGFP